MTLGTNANLEELIKYSPQEIDFDFILAELEELDEWRELGEAAGDVEGQIASLEVDIELKDEQIEKLEEELDDHQYEIERLKKTIDDMISSY